MTDPKANVELSAADISANWMMIQSVNPAELRLKSREKLPAFPTVGVTVREDSFTIVPSIR